MSKTLTHKSSWKALAEHHEKLESKHLRELFDEDATRGTRLTLEAVGVYLDYSKNRVTDKTLKLLVDLAEDCGLQDKIDAMFRGDRINTTENRAVLHVALRAPRWQQIPLDGVDVVPAVHEVLDRMAAFSDQVRSGQWRGYTGKRIRHVVNIGIGGSDLGPVMAYEALRFYSNTRASTFRFVSNIDGNDFDRSGARSRCGRNDVHHFIENVHDARDDDQCRQAARDVGPSQQLGSDDAVAKHFVAVSTNAAGVVEVRHRHRQTCSASEDWVGGRYSMDSAIGLSTMLAIGPESFSAMLGRLPRNGRALPQRHRSSTNIPVHAWVCSQLWYNDMFGFANASPCCRTKTISSASPRICSSSRWRATAST